MYGDEKVEAMETELEELKKLIVRYAIHVNDCEGSYFLYSWGGEFTELDAAAIRGLLDMRAPGWRDR